MGKYLTEIGAYMVPIPTCLNRKAFDGLPNDLKKIVYKQLRRLSQLAPTINTPSDLEAVENMKKAGVEIITMSPSELEKARKLVEPLWEEFIKKNEALGAAGKTNGGGAEILDQKALCLVPRAAHEEGNGRTDSRNY